MERKIGEIFTTRYGTRLIVEENPCCDDCYFNKMKDCSIFNHETGACLALARKDMKSVIFKKI